MLDQIKKRRLKIAQQLDANRPRINSSQKRKQIQANLQKFKKDVKQSRSNSPFQSANNFYPKQNYSEMQQSPTMKDLINPFLKQSNQPTQIKNEQIQSPRFKQPIRILQKQQKNSQENKKNQQQQNQIHPNLQFQQKNNLQNKYDPNQFDISISNNSQQKNEGEKLQRQVSFGAEELQKTIDKLNTPKSIQNNSNKFQPSYQKKQDNPLQLNFNYNQSNYGSSNGSSAIFFTSQFRDYLNNGKTQPNQNQQIQPIVHQNQPKQVESDHVRDSQSRTHTDKQIGDSFLKIADQQLSESHSQSRTKKLLHNQSGRSLAFSNNQQSLLKQSKANQYANYHDLVNKKLDQELVLEIEHFGKNKIKEMVQRYIQFLKTQRKLNTSFIKQFQTLAKLNELQKKRQLNQKRYYFDGFLILKQYKFEQIKNQIKADNFLKEQNQKLLKKIFRNWKNLGLQQQKKLLIHQKKKDQKIQKNVFQVFKMIWFDSKVKHQIDLYYLSKIFSAFKNAITNQRKKSQNMALKLYCKSLKRVYFYKLQQGIEITKKQRLNQQLAQQHYRGTTMKKFFDAWVEQSDRSPQYVSLTMTSKNVFKQTLDNKWLGIKTVDFKQLKQ